MSELAKARLAHLMAKLKELRRQSTQTVVVRNGSFCLTFTKERSS